MARALAHDRGLEVDAVVRARARTTTARTRSSCRPAAAASSTLTVGFPAEPRAAVRLRRAHHRQRRERLLHARAAADGRRLRRRSAAAACWSLGGRSFAQRGLIGTPLEEVLPLELNDRRGGLARAAYSSRARRAHQTRDADARTARLIRSCASAPRPQKTRTALGGDAGAGRERAARRSASGRQRPGGDLGARRRRRPARRGAALRPGPIDGVHRRRRRGAGR